MSRRVKIVPAKDTEELFRLFTRAIVHAVNNFLSAASGYHQLAGHKLAGPNPPDPELIKSYVSKAEEAVVGAGEMFSRIADWAKPRAITPFPVMLADEVESAVGRLAEQHTTVAGRISRESEPDLSPVPADSSLIGMAVDALLDNARQAISSPDGRIEVRVSRVSAGEGGGKSTWQEIQVKDDGAGIPPHRLGRFWIPVLASFQSGLGEESGWSGAGFGLPMVWLCAAQHGGEVEVESAVGEGTSVYVRLPEQRGETA